MAPKNYFASLTTFADELGECPRWDDRENCLYWVDITGRRLHRLDEGKEDVTTIVFDEDIGCFSLHEKGGFVAGMRTGIWRLANNGRKIQKLASNPEDAAYSRFNDGRADSAGRFWLGTVDESGRGNARLYRFSNHVLDVVADGLKTSNGLAFSADGRWMYHSDTPRFVIYRYPFNVRTGEVGARQEWVRLAPTESDKGRPDGAAVDKAGRYWVALYEGGAVGCFSPEGELQVKYRIPARCPTMCAFGGSDFKTLFVTTASGGRSNAELQEYPLSGRLFSMRVDVPGIVEPRCL